MTAPRRFQNQSVTATLSARSPIPRGTDGAAAGPGHAELYQKYDIKVAIGAGGMGEVLLVADRDLRRDIAMKVMQPHLAGERDHLLRFLAEAQTTAQLEHPGVPPVHELGLTADGEPYFTMKLVRGRTLDSVLQDLLVGRPEIRREYTLHRLVSVLLRICDTLHFAHERGVIHRDLKPQNVMLGDYGEVHVMDWGLARVGSGVVEDTEPVATVRTESALETEHGRVTGTLPYLSPEQTEGVVALDRRVDVWAAGCILYEILTLHMAFGGADPIPAIREGKFAPVRERNPRRPVPEDLARVCERCLRVDPAERPATAKDLGDLLSTWLDGSMDRARRRDQASRLVERGRAEAARFRSLSTDAREAELSAQDAAAEVEPWRPLAAKLPVIEARERAVRLRRDGILAFAEATKWLEAALITEERNAAARAALAQLWRERLRDAEAEGILDVAAHALELLRRYDDGELAGVVSGDGVFRLESEPSGARVTLHRLEDLHGLLWPGEGEDLGTTPVGPRSLPMGSYLCILRMPGYRDVRYPVYISRCREWTGDVRMRTDPEIGEGFVLVPGGPFLYGEGRGVKNLELPDFAIARHPVTFGEYLEFVQDIDRRLGSEAARRRVPGTPGDGPYAERIAEGNYRTLPTIVEGPARARCLREQGEGFEARVPVMGVSWNDAAAYCEWRSERTGRPWRLPTEQESEKASRGVDGRRFPWGELADATLAKCQASRNEPSQPEPVGSFPAATSVYGMADAAGGVWEWTASWYDAHRTARVVRGGSWDSQPDAVRCAHRYRNNPDYRMTDYGFRCARSL